MQKRAGLLFFSTNTGRVLLVLEDTKWTVPTFPRLDNLLKDAHPLIDSYYGKPARVLPIELYLSEDKGFEYGTYVCLVKDEFLTTVSSTISWSSLKNLPKQLHTGLKNTLNNPIIRTKLDTILELENAANFGKQ
jgi:hypothetical protein